MVIEKEANAGRFSGCLVINLLKKRKHENNKSKHQNSKFAQKKLKWTLKQLLYKVNLLFI